jgi:glycosyltransferase involved in cell wall biosynthesis
MKIAVNTRFLIKNKLEGIGWFTYETMKRITCWHPEHEFYFFFDRPFDAEFIFSDNIRPMVLFPPARHPVLWYVWFECTVPRALRQIKPDIFISTDGFLSLSTDIPSLLVVHDLAFEHYPHYISRAASVYYRHFTPLYCRKARQIITVSEASKNDIANRYHIGTDKITVAYNGTGDHFKPLNDEEKIHVRNRYSEGKNYFLYSGSLHPRKNIVNLLKAFEQFKMQSNADCKLVLAGARGWMLREMEATLNNMRSRHDIIFTGHLDKETLAKIVGSALAMVYVSLFEGFGLPVAEAMKCGVPVITSNLSSMPEVAGNAALLVNPSDTCEIAQAMLRVYNEAGLRAQLIEKGKQQAARFSWDHTAAIIWQVASDMLNNR